MNLDNIISTASIATVFSGVTSAIVATLVARFNISKNEEKALNDILLLINQLTIQHPHFEDDKYISKYSKIKTKTDKELRYEYFCVIVFNFLERLCKHYNYNMKKVSDFVHYKELIQTHQHWWYHSDDHKENIKGYEPKFIEVVNNVIKEG